MKKIFTFISLVILVAGLAIPLSSVGAWSGNVNSSESCEGVTVTANPQNHVSDNSGQYRERWVPVSVTGTGFFPWEPDGENEGGVTIIWQKQVSNNFGITYTNVQEFDDGESPYKWKEKKNNSCPTLTPTSTTTTVPTNTITLTATEERKIPWCHFEPNGNYQTLHLPAAALQSAGHMDANGNPLHAGDHPGECVDPTSTSTATLSPTQTMTATPTLVQCNWLEQILLGDVCVDFTNTPTIQPSATNTEAPTETGIPTVTDTVDPGTPTLVESTATNDPGTPTLQPTSESTVTNDPGTPVVDPTGTTENLSTATKVPKGPAEYCTKLLEGRPDQPRWQDNPRCVEYFKNAGGSNWFDRLLIWVFGS